MVRNSNRLSRFWQELKRRNVHRSLAVYTGTAFIILEAADILFPRWELPNWTFNLVLYLLILGAVITIIISWLFDVTSEGIEKTKPVSEIRDEAKHVTSKGWKAATLVSIVVIIGLVIFNITGGFRQVKTGSITSVLIFPIENYTGDDALEYLVSGMTSELNAEMGQISNLRVISEYTSKYYKDAGMPLKQIAEEQNIDYIVEPAALCHGDSICVLVKLIGIRGEEKQLWVEEYREDKNQILDFYSNVTRKIADGVRVELTDKEEEMLAKSQSVDPDAYEAIMKGLYYHSKYTRESLDSAMKYFELAKGIDPEYAPAYLGICATWDIRGQLGYISHAESGPKADAALMKAFELDSMNAQAHGTLAAKKVWRMYDWAGGEAGYKKSLSLNPNNAGAHQTYSHLLMILGREEEAMEHIEIALKLDPMNPFVISFYAMNLIQLRNFDEAIQAYQKAIRIEPGYPLALGSLADSYYLSGRPEKAWETMQSSLKLCDPDMLETCEQGYAENGYEGALMNFARFLEMRAEEQYVQPTSIALQYALIGENDKAIYWLERAYEEKDPSLPYLRLPQYDNLYNDPRFQDLCRRMSLPLLED